MFFHLLPIELCLLLGLVGTLMIIRGVFQAVGQVLLRSVVIWVVVGILVCKAAAQRRSSTIMGIFEMSRYVSDFAALNILHGFVYGH